MTRSCRCCGSRDEIYVRDNFMGDVDVTAGLESITDEVWKCPECRAHYQRIYDAATFFHDYDEHRYQRLAPRSVMVCRCPECGSDDAYADESRSYLEFTHMQCDGCGQGGLNDVWQQDEWYVEVVGYYNPRRPDSLVWWAPGHRIELTYGCLQCMGLDQADNAFSALTKTALTTLVSESHFSVRLTQCACGQAFAVVFTEIIDWKDGEDDQTWLAMPVTSDEVLTLKKTTEDELPGYLAARNTRRFLVRHLPTGGQIHTFWRDGGFRIGRHD